MNFGEYLKIQREDRGWTQPVAAEKIGIEQSYLSKLETGKATPSEEMFERLARGYEFDLDRLAESVSPGELERLREIAAIRDLVRRGQQIAARGRRRWLVASLLLLALGGALLSFVVTESRYPRMESVYMSKGVIKDAESDFIFGGFRRMDPSYIVEFHEDDPLVQRLDPAYLWFPENIGDYFVEPVEGGRRLYKWSGLRKTTPHVNVHLGHALAVAMLIAGLGGLFVARRW